MRFREVRVRDKKGEKSPKNLEFVSVGCSGDCLIGRPWNLRSN